MNSSVHELIGEIRGLARGRISEAQLNPVLDEVRAHLDASIQARLEMGLNETEASKEAIESFGEPQVFVSKMVSHKGPHRDKVFDVRVFAAIMATILFAAMTEVGSTWSAYTFPTGILLILAVCWFVIFYFSWRTKRAQILVCLACTLIAIPIFATSWSFGDLPDRDFSLTVGMTLPEVYNERGRTGNRLNQTQTDEQNMYALAQRYWQHPKQNEAPMRPTMIGHAGRIEFSVEPANSASEAAAMWQDQFELGIQEYAQIRRSIYRDASNLEEKIQRPWWLNALYHLPIGAMTALVYGIFLSAASLWAWLLRVTWNGLRTKRTPRATA